jgi:hypothetical protein
VPTLRRLTVAAPIVALTAGASAPAEHLSTRDYLDLPEIFQVSVVTGSLAVLEHYACALPECACFARWTAAGDVVAIVSDHARTRPETLDAPFASTLVRALTERCAS